MWRVLALCLALLAVGNLSALDYPIVYVRTPRFGDGTDPAHKNVFLPEVGNPVRFNAGTDLVVRYPDGSERVLVDAGEGQAIDPYPDFKAQWVYYAFFPDKRRSDIYKVNVATGEKVRLTHQESTPHTGWVSRRGTVVNATRPVYNLGPCPLPGGRVVFTSTRNQLSPAKGFTAGGCHQLFVMDADGKNVEQVGFLNLAGALHPTVLKDGRIMWSSMETQGRRWPGLWALWASYPDGRHWEPLFSAFAGGRAAHFSTQDSAGKLTTTLYYNMFNGGLGELVRFDAAPAFRPADMKLVPKVSREGPIPFQPYSLENLAPWSSSFDAANAAGKLGHPAAAPCESVRGECDLLVTYSPGPANSKKNPTNKPYFDYGIYLLRGVAEKPDDLMTIVNSPEYNENQPRALVSYKRLYGIDEPKHIPFTPHDSGHPLLPPGTPYGLIGTSGVYSRESKGVNRKSNMVSQGGDAGEFENSDIHAIRILTQEPTSRLHIKRDFEAVGNERLRVLGEIPLRKTDAMDKPIFDPNGDPDTSFLARIPADVPFTFQLIDKQGLVLTTAQTWHQLRPGEIRWDCRGCHAHHKPGIPFTGTAASKPDYKIADLTKNKPWTVEYFRDVEPIFKAYCWACHGPDKEKPAGGVVLDHKAGRHGNYDMGRALGGRVSAYQARVSKLYQLVRDDAMPPKGHIKLIPEQKLTIARWIDLGCQINKQGPNYPEYHTRSIYGNGVFSDDLKPTLTLESPRRDGATDKIRFGAFDFSSIKSISVKASFWVNGRKPGAELFDLFGAPKDGIYSLTLGTTVKAGLITIIVTDRAGHTQKVMRTFSGKIGSLRSRIRVKK